MIAFTCLDVLRLGPQPNIYIYSIGPIIPIGRKEDFDITTITLLLSHVIYVCAITFSTAQRMLLMLLHSRRTFIKFLRLYVPHILRCDVDPRAGDFIGTRAGIFLLVFLSDTNIAWSLDSLHFCTHKYQEPVRGEFLPLRKSLKHFHLLSFLLFFT